MNGVAPAVPAAPRGHESSAHPAPSVAPSAGREGVATGRILAISDPPVLTRRGWSQGGRVWTPEEADLISRSSSPAQTGCGAASIPRPGRPRRRPWPDPAHCRPPALLHGADQLPSPTPRRLGPGRRRPPGISGPTLSRHERDAAARVGRWSPHRTTAWVTGIATPDRSPGARSPCLLRRSAPPTRHSPALGDAPSSIPQKRASAACLALCRR